jgi:hypothetical protein
MPFDFGLLINNQVDEKGQSPLLLNLRFPLMGAAHRVFIVKQSYLTPAPRRRSD